MPTTNPTKEDIIRTLATIQNDQQNNRRNYMQAQPYQNFMPQTHMGYQPQQNDQWGQTLQGIDQIGKNATELSLVIAQNKAAKDAQQRAAQREALARKRANTIGKYTASGSNSGSTPAPSGSNSYNAITGQWGGGFNPNAPLVTRNWHGFSLRMNASVIGRFTHFLTALAGEGYKIKSIGTYANRNIANTNVKSLHAYGLAMDINPSENPVTYNGHTITNLPPNVGALAARYGIMWGGAWVHNKRDAMHFSVPYGGRM